MVYLDRYCEPLESAYVIFVAIDCNAYINNLDYIKWMLENSFDTVKILVPYQIYHEINTLVSEAD